MRLFVISSTSLIHHTAMKKNFLLVLALSVGILTGCKKTNSTDSANGKSDTTTVDTIAADTTASEVVTPQKDTFNTIRKSNRLRSKDVDENLGGYLFSDNDVKLSWPSALCGCKNIEPLQKALLKEAFDYTKDVNVEAAVQKYLKEPAFIDENGKAPACIPAKQGETNEECMSCNYTKSVFVYPKTDSPTLTTYCIYKYSFTGGAHGMYTESYVVFDRVGGRVMTDRMFTNVRNASLLNVVNQQIKAESRIKKEPLGAASGLSQYYPGAKGMVFVFQPYDIASYAQGLITITVPYSKLESFFTPEFKEMIKEASTFKTLKSSF